jgi:hypothetical protein
MPASPMTASTRYVRFGITKFYYCPAIAIKTAPTRAELNAGTDVSGEVAAIDGWTAATDFVDTADLSGQFVPQLAGRLKAASSSLTFYASSNSIDVRSLLPRATVGFVVILDEGDVAGRKMAVFPITVGAQEFQRGLEDAAQIQITFAITSAPAENVTVPA